MNLNGFFAIVLLFILLVVFPIWFIYQIEGGIWQTLKTYFVTIGFVSVVVLFAIIISVLIKIGF